jgi:hypothetical protein
VELFFWITFGPPGMAAGFLVAWRLTLSGARLFALVVFGSFAVIALFWLAVAVLGVEGWDTIAFFLSACANVVGWVLGVVAGTAFGRTRVAERGEER